MPDKFCNRMSAKTKRAHKRNRYLKSRDSASLYMKEYRESNKGAIRGEGQKQYYEQNKDIIKSSVKHYYEVNKEKICFNVKQHYGKHKDAKICSVKQHYEIMKNYEQHGT